MDGRETRKNFLEFYFDPNILNEDEAGEILKEDGLDIENIKNEAFEMITRKKAELKINKGKEFKALAEELQNNCDSTNDAKINYKIAARNLDGLSENDKKVINESMDLLNKLEEQ